MTQTDILLQSILHPPKEYTPIPFWFFNDVPDREKIKRQLKDFTEKGVNGIVLHPRIGIPRKIAYLSPEFFRVVRFVVETASGLDMKIVLYDEGMYPSGSAHGMVVAENPEFASKGLTRTVHVREGDQVLARLPEGGFLVVRRTGGNIRGIHFGEDDGEPGAPPSADILNPEAVEAFIRLTHERYYEELKEYFGNTIIGFFTDEPCALGRNAEGFFEWAQGLEQELCEAGGEISGLKELFDGKENRTTAIYHRLIKKHLRETFYAPLSAWCASHGISLMGHPAESDDVEEAYYFQIPGQDLIMRRVAPESGGLLEPDSVQAKLSADIARHLGRRRNANECFGVCGQIGNPWHFTGRDLKWYIDWLAMRGVNLFIPHAFYYSVAGARKEERPPDVGPHNIWWKHYRKFSDYMKRLSFLMTDSRNGARIAVLCDNNRVPCKEAAWFYENQVEFNYLPAAFLKDCRVEQGRLCISGYRYEIILNVLGEEWDESIPGGLVVHGTADIPREVNGKAICTVRITAVNDPECAAAASNVMPENRAAARNDAMPGDCAAAASNAVSDPSAISVPGADCRKLRAVHLIKEGTDMYLFSNEGERPIHTSLTIPAEGIPVLVDLWNGSWYLASGGKQASEKLEISLEPRETLLVMMAKEETWAAEKRMQKAEEGKTGHRPPENWNHHFKLIKKEDNQAIYEYTLPADGKELSDCFEVTGEEMAECFWNGELIGVSFWSPHRFSLEGCGQDAKGSAEGKNTGERSGKMQDRIRLILTGSAANQYSDIRIPYGLEPFCRGRQ